MPTIRDVAKTAGVATTTVSRVLNNSGYVSAATRARVEAAIQELGYVPNRVARSLRLKRTHTLALVVTDITNPFWTTVVRGVEDAAHEAGFTVILCNTDESESQAGRLPAGAAAEAGGRHPVCPGAAATPEAVELVQRQNVPIVVLDRRVPGAEVDVVRGDSEGGAYQLVRHLLELGHRRIAVLSGPETVSTSIERVAGYRRALREAGLGEEAEWVHYGAVHPGVWIRCDRRGPRRWTRARRPFLPPTILSPSARCARCAMPGCVCRRTFRWSPLTIWPPRC